MRGMNWEMRVRHNGYGRTWGNKGYSKGQILNKWKKDAGGKKWRAELRDKKIDRSERREVDPVPTVDLLTDVAISPECRTCAHKYAAWR